MKTKKVYSIDTGLAQSVGFSFSKNTGKLMENMVFLALRRKGHDIHYYKTNQDFEVDFFLPKENTLIQVAQNFDHAETRERELRALTIAALEQKGNPRLIVVTENTRETLIMDGATINIVPLYEWLLESYLNRGINNNYCETIPHEYLPHQGPVS